MVRVGDFQPAPDDATEAFRKAVATGAKRVVFNRIGFDYQLQPVQLRSDLELIWEPGVRVMAKAGAFRDPNDVLFTAGGVKNLTLTGGADSQILMRKQDYRNRRLYPRSEWRHAVSLLGCENVTIRGLRIASSGGDGIYLGRTKGTAAFCRNVLIENCVIADNHRQGISVISAVDLTIRNCVISNTRGTPPEAGIDFEPNLRDERVENCLVEKVCFVNNAWSAVNFTVFSDWKVSAVVRDCEIVCGKKAPALSFCSIRPGKSTGNVRFSNITITECASDVLLFSNFGKETSYAVEIDNLRADAAAGIKSSAVPIAFEANCRWCSIFGGVTVRNFTVGGFRTDQVVEFRSWNDNVSLEAVAGEMVLNGKKIDLASYIAQNPAMFRRGSFPVPERRSGDLLKPSGKGVAKPSPLWRSATDILIYAEAGDVLAFSLDLRGLGPGISPQPIEWKLLDPAGRALALSPYQHKTKQRNATVPFRIKAAETGFYTLHLPRHGNTAIGFRPDQGLRWSMAAASSSSGVLNFIRLDPGRNTEFFFEVPASVSEFDVEVGGQTSEPVDFYLLDASGTVRAKETALESARKFHVKRTPGGSEIWRMKLFRAVEDVCFRFSPELPGIFSVSPECLPRRKTPTE